LEACLRLWLNIVNKANLSEASKRLRMEDIQTGLLMLQTFILETL
jgi:hypothetical protein